MRGRTTGPDASACGNKRLVIWISLAIRKKETTDPCLKHQQSFTLRIDKAIGLWLWTHLPPLFLLGSVCALYLIGIITMAKEVSHSMTIVLVFITHSFVNLLLLLPWNSLRCSFWNTVSCTIDENWILNWLCFSRFHVLTLLLCLVKTSMGNYLFEQRLLSLCSVLMLNYVSTGIFAIDFLNKPMAGLQCLIYFGLLFMSLKHLTMSTVIPLPSQLRSSSFDMRRSLPLVTVSLGIQFALSMLRVSDMTFGSGRNDYKGDSSSPIYKIMSSAAVNDMFFASLILGIFFLVGTRTQQKALLVGQTMALFISLVMLAGAQGERIESEQMKAGGVATFFSILIALLGMV